MKLRRLWGLFDEARLANPTSILECEIDSAARIDLRAAFSATFGLCFAHLDS